MSYPESCTRTSTENSKWNFSDSFSALLGLDSLKLTAKTTPYIFEIKNKFLKLKSITDANRKLFWIPTHCEIEDNEPADFTAKQATKIQHHHSLKIPFTDLTLLFKKRQLLNSNISIEAAGEIKGTEYLFWILS